MESLLQASARATDHASRLASFALFDIVSTSQIIMALPVELLQLRFPLVSKLWAALIVHHYDVNVNCSMYIEAGL